MYLTSSWNRNSVPYLQLWIIFYSLSSRYIFSDSFNYLFILPCVSEITIVWTGGKIAI